MNRSQILGPLVTALLLVACTDGAGAAPSVSPGDGLVAGNSAPASASSPAPRPTALAQLPVDSSIAPVSESEPPADAAAAMQDCYVDYFGVATISGMGLVPHARDIGKYIPVRGQEPELATDDPAWAITFAGKVTLPRGLGWTVDPACVVVDGERYFYIVGERGNGSVSKTPRPFANPPTMALPALVR